MFIIEVMFNDYIFFPSIYDTERFQHTFDYFKTSSSGLSRIAHHQYRNKMVLETRVPSLKSIHDMVNSLTF